MPRFLVGGGSWGRKLAGKIDEVIVDQTDKAEPHPEDHREVYEEADKVRVRDYF